MVTAQGPDGPIGFTCQSFSSLSPDPPLVCFAPARSSSSWPRIRDVGTFCVNVLAADHKHHSAGFARSGVAALPPRQARAKPEEAWPQTLGAAQLAELRFVATPEGTATRDVLEEQLRGLGIEPRIAVETAHHAMIMPLVLAGAGASLLPASMAEDAATKGAQVRPTVPTLRYRPRLVWRAGPLSPAADSFVAMARSRHAPAHPVPGAP